MAAPTVKQMNFLAQLTLAAYNISVQIFLVCEWLSAIPSAVMLTLVAVLASPSYWHGRHAHFFLSATRRRTAAECQVCMTDHHHSFSAWLPSATSSAHPVHLISNSIGPRNALRPPFINPAITAPEHFSRHHSAMCACRNANIPPYALSFPRQRIPPDPLIVCIGSRRAVCVGAAATSTFSCLRTTRRCGIVG
ncbi:hypothetical protein B0H21DRAFT_470097 [Amylocystis lapponica]|nr:hypothetical protein B0H21DRAFT_470097 [Amylocystis lapponica]